MLISCTPPRKSTATSTHTEIDAFTTPVSASTMTTTAPTALNVAVRVPRYVARLNGTSEKEVTASVARRNSCG